MPLKLFYNGSAVMYSEQSPDCLKALERAREAKEREAMLNSWNSLTPKEDNVRIIMAKEEYKEPRNYRIKHHNRQQLISSGIYGHENKNHEVLFLTLTYKNTCFKKATLEEKSKNGDIVKFLNNLRTNYGMKGYEWTKELTKNGTPHYHLLADLPFIDIHKLNKIWTNNAGFKSNNAVRYDPDNGLIVKNPDHAGFYVAKYISKLNSDIAFKSRCYTISNNWQAPILTINDPGQIKSILYEAKNVHELEYTTTFNIDRDIGKQIFDFNE